MNLFSQRLKQMMGEQGVTQTDLCTKVGLGKSSVSQYVSGKNIPNTFRMKMIADALNVSPDWLSGSIDEPATDTGHPNNLPVEVAARLMGVGKQFIRVGLRNGTFPFGYAVLMPSGKYRYYISPKKFIEYTGIEI